jgi:hypothetical protein
MKTLIFLLFCIAAVACSQPKESQTGSADQGIGRMIKDQEYTFTARTVLPTGGRIVQLTSNYDMRVSKDSVISFLPYFGRAYTAPIGGTNAGIQFTSTDFNYKVSERKKGGWQILIRPKDVQDIQQVNLTVSEGGSASLQVTSNNRQPISYNGVIEER